MAHQPPYRPARYRDPASEGDPRRVARYLLGLVAVLALIAALAALAAFQITSSEPAKDSLRRAAAALTEIDALLDRHEEQLRADAESAEPGDTLELEDFPISLALAPEDVLATDHGQLRALILDRSADRLYEDGTRALRGSAEAQGSIGLFSIAGVVDRGLGALTSENHTMFGILMVVLFAGALILIAATAATCRGWGRLTAVGVTILLAGAITLVLGWFSMWSAGSSAGDQDVFVRAELLRILEDLMLAPTRNGAAALIAGVVIVAAAFAAGVASRADGRSAAPEVA